MPEPTRFFQDIINQVHTLGIDVRDTVAIFETLREAMEQLDPESVEEIEKIWLKASQNVEEFTKQLAEAAVTNEKLAKASQKVNDAYKQLEHAINEQQRALESLRKTAISVTDTFFKFFAGLRQGVFQTGLVYDKMYAIHAELDKRLKATAATSLLVTNAWAGVGKEGTRAFKSAVDSLLDVNINFATFAKHVGLSTEEIQSLSKEVSSWYDITHDVLFTTREDLGENISQWGLLGKAIAISRGLGLDLSDTFSQIKTLFYDVGKSIDESVKSLVHMQQAASYVGISTRALIPIVNEIASSFKFLGFDIAGSTRFIGEFAKAGRQIGLGPGAALELTRNFMEAAKGMQMATKAFFAQIGGLPEARGRGAIGAGLALEEAMARGRWQEVASSIQRAVETISGMPLLTRERALQMGPVGEDIYFTQRQFIQQQLGLEWTQAARLMQVLAAREVGGMPGVDIAEEFERIMTERGGADYMKQTVDVQKQIQLTTGKIEARITKSLSDGNIRRWQESMQQYVNIATDTYKTLEKISQWGSLISRLITVIAVFQGISAIVQSISAVREIPKMVGGIKGILTTLKESRLFQVVANMGQVFSRVLPMLARFGLPIAGATIGIGGGRRLAGPEGSYWGSTIGTVLGGLAGFGLSLIPGAQPFATYLISGGMALGGLAGGAVERWIRGRQQPQRQQLQDFIISNRRYDVSREDVVIALKEQQLQKGLTERTRIVTQTMDTKFVNAVAGLEQSQKEISRSIKALDQVTARAGIRDIPVTTRRVVELDVRPEIEQRFTKGFLSAFKEVERLQRGLGRAQDTEIVRRAIVPTAIRDTRVASQLIGEHSKDIKIKFESEKVEHQVDLRVNLLEGYIRKIATEQIKTLVRSRAIVPDRAFEGVTV